MYILRSALAAAAVAAAVLAAPLASAHAVLKSSEPQAGAMLTTPPQQIVLTFNEKVEPAFSSVTVSNAKGEAITNSKAAPDPSNPTIMMLPVPSLAAGSYTVKWAVAGHDGHRRTGEFKFTVK